MMIKRKQHRSFLARVWDAFSLAQYFEQEMNLSPEEVADKLLLLRENDQPRWGNSASLSRVVDIKYVGKGVYTFDIRTRRQGRGIYTTSRARGSLEKTGITILITGNVRLDTYNQTGGLFVVLISIAAMYSPYAVGQQIPLPIAIVLSLIFILFLLFSWWEMYQDRNELIQLITEIVTDDKQNTSTHLEITEENQRFDDVFDGENIVFKKPKTNG